jgi:capsular exopolysaccharide synthesis family protein
VEYLDTTIKTREDVEKLLQVPVMGYVPPIPEPSGNGHDETPVEFTALNKPHSTVAEAFRSIRTALTFSDAGRGLKTLLMTSSIPSEGKTLVSINLAMALAKTGKRVLIVDGDMRKPRLTRILNPASRHGLSSLLINAPDVTLETAVMDMGIENLYALPSGPIPPNPAELLGSERLGELIEEMGRHYDHILFDTPPVVHATDAAVLCQRVQGALLVVRAFSTQRDLVVRAKDIIHGARGRLVGTILNSVDMPDSGHYGYGAYYYYGKYYGDAGTGIKARKKKTGASPDMNRIMQKNEEKEKRHAGQH